MLAFYQFYFVSKSLLFINPIFADFKVPITFYLIIFGINICFGFIKKINSEIFYPFVILSFLSFLFFCSFWIDPSSRMSYITKCDQGLIYAQSRWGQSYVLFTVKKLFQAPNFIGEIKYFSINNSQSYLNPEFRNCVEITKYDFEKNYYKLLN